MIELLDELAGGVREAAWPVIRQDLGLTYLQIGLLLSVPAILSGLFEPALGILSDIRNRRIMVLGGGALFAVSLILTSMSQGFWLLLLSFVLFYPASGAFVSLSQAELMDRFPSRRDQTMARWTFAGSVGAVAGPLVLGATGGAGFGWRALFLTVGVLSVVTVAVAARSAFPAHQHGGLPRERSTSFIDGLRGAVRALAKRRVLRWLALLETANLMLDVLTGFLALYFVDVAGVSARFAAFTVTLWTGAGLVGDFLLIPLLGRWDGMRYLRVSAAAVGVIFPCFLLAEPVALKVALLALVGLLRAGWYAILQARLYESLPGQSGVALALMNVSGLAAALIPLGVSALAQVVGLHGAMWALMAAPLALLVGLPRRER